MDRGKIFERLLRSNVADILTPLATMTRKWPRPVYEQTALTSFGPKSSNMGDISQSQGLYSNSKRLWFSVKRTEEIFLNAYLRVFWPTY